MATIELRDLNPAEFNNNLIVYGRLGVGTASPSNALHVYGDSANGEIKTERSSGAVSLIQAQASLVRFGATSNHNLQLISNDDTKVTITTAGRLGIGTTSPSTELHVIGDTTVNNTSSNAVINLTSDSNSSILNFTNSNEGAVLRSDTYIRIDTNGSNERIRVLSDGKVGIGTTSPSDLFEISSSSPVIRGTDTDGGAAKVNFDSGNVTLDADFGASQSSSIINFKIDGSEVARFDSSGNLAIGTTSPAEELHVVSSSTGTIRLDGSAAQIEIQSEGSTRGSIGTITNHPFRLISNNTERVTVLADGKVGIGLTSPLTKLHVANTGSGDDIKFETTDANDLNFVLEAGTSNNNFSIKVNNSTDRLDILADANTRLSVLDNGNVGINETTPTEKLHVDGNLKVTGDVLIGSTATSITEVGPYDPYVLYHWTGRQYQNGGSSDIMYFNGDALYYADADSPWNKSSVAAANPESLTTLVGGATFNRTYQTSNWNWHYMIRLDNTTKTDSALPTKYMRIKMPVYYTAGASEHHVFYFQVLNDRQSGFQLCVCDSSGNPVKRAAVQHKNGGGYQTYGSFQRGPNNSHPLQSSGHYGEWTNSLIMGSHIDSYSFADSDSPTGRSIYLSINCNTANSNNYIYFMGFAMGKNKKGVAITTPRIIVNGANDPTRGKVNLYGNGWRHHNNWYWSEMAYVHQQHASTTPIQIAGTDKDVIISFMLSGHSDHNFERTTLFLTDKDSNQRYDGAGGGNFGYDSHVPNQWVNAGLMNIGSFTGSGSDKMIGYSHRGGQVLTWIINKALLQELAYDVDGIMNLRIGASQVADHWRHGYVRGIATEQINS
tara:strand:- start:692 stop:3193 length:2502 start_codon:yes stop_codon:yes gene_type:complete